MKVTKTPIADAKLKWKTCSQSGLAPWELYVTKRQKRQNLKPAGKCIFCEGGAVPNNPMTGEHFWSDWIDHDGLIPKSMQHIAFRNIIDKDTRETRSDFFRERQGDHNSITLKVVCRSCNNDWMSGIETSAKPILSPLISGAPSVLTLEAKTKISVWFFLKMLVVEHASYRNSPARPIFSQPVRNSFVANKLIVPGVRMWIARQIGFSWCARYYRHSVEFLTCTEGFPKPEFKGINNSQTFAWGLNKLLFFSTATTDPDLFHLFGIDEGWALYQIWPPNGPDLLWPPADVLSDLFIDILSNWMETYIHRIKEDNGRVVI